MWRTDFGIPVWRASYGEIGLYPNPKTRPIEVSRDFERVQAVLVEQARSASMSPIGYRKLRSNAGDVYCFEFRSNKLSSVVCLFDHTTLSVRFDGAPNYMDDVFEVVSSARRIGSPR